MEKLEFDFDLEFNIVEFGDVEFFCWFFSWIFEYDSGDLEFNIVELVKLNFFLLDFWLDIEYDSVDFGKVGI